MKVLVSACLLGINCKYNGKNNYNEKVLEYIKNKEFLPICPEQLAGLTTPRVPIEIKNGKVYNELGIDLTEQIDKGILEALKLIDLFKPDKAILKAKSPTCGLNEIYDGSFTHTLTKGNGKLSEKLLELGIELLTEKDL